MLTECWNLLLLVDFRADGKNHDAFLMCYKSDTEAGLNERERNELKSVLEDRFGYSLCLYDRDVLPGTGMY